MGRISLDLPPEEALAKVESSASFTDELRNVLQADDREQEHPLFIELNELVINKRGQQIWREMARWIKFEENVEVDAQRWSKPHVSTVSLNALFELRYVILNGPMILDATIISKEELIDVIVEKLENEGQVDSEQAEAVRSVLLTKFTHQLIRKAVPLIKTISHMKGGKDSSVPDFSNEVPDAQLSHNPVEAVDEVDTQQKAHHEYMMHKIPHGSESASILLGEVDFLQNTVSCFVRLHPAVFIPNMTEVMIPTRFCFMLLGPRDSAQKYAHIGRALGVLLTDEVFHEVVYKALTRQELLCGIDEFLSNAIVLPPSIWDPDIRIEPPEHLPDHKRAKSLKQKTGPVEKAAITDKAEKEEDESLARSGFIFGGLVKDIKRKIKVYLSDYTDAFALQIIAACIFMYVVTLAPLITFGGLLEHATHQTQATMECILSGAICGFLFALFAGQPLVIMSATGPMLVVESLVYEFSQAEGLEYLPFRLWIGIWVTLILLVLVAFDASSLVRHITRFTEECFACLISLIFIYDAFKSISEIYYDVPIDTHPEEPQNLTCWCEAPINSTDDYSIFPPNETCLQANGTLQGPGCGVVPYVPDVFLLCLMLFLGTFVLTMLLKHVRNTNFFPSIVRQLIYDFALPISILVMCAIDASLGLDTPKLTVPDKFEPTQSGRPWVIPIMADNPWWAPLAATLPAVVCTILIFMDQQITAVIVNRKENLLKKGHGYHLDLLVVAAGIIICSIFGLPWFVAMTVLSINHVQALRVDSGVTAPGEKPSFIGIRENRVTGLFVAVMVACSVVLTSVLQYVAMPVLYGVFLYMGVAALDNVQFVDRILVIFMPPKYQPDYIYIRHLKAFRIHIYTLIQIGCMIVMWVLKSFEKTSMFFPVSILLLVVVRKLMRFIFTPYELVYLDSETPETIVKAREDLERKEREKQEQAESEEDKEIGEMEHMISVNGKMARARPRRGTFVEVDFKDQIIKSGAWALVKDEFICMNTDDNKIAESQPLTSMEAPSIVIDQAEDRRPSKTVRMFSTKM